MNRSEYGMVSVFRFFLHPLLMHKYKDNVHSFYRNEKRYARIYIVLKETLYEINIMECKWNQSLYQ